MSSARFSKEDTEMSSVGPGSGEPRPGKGGSFSTGKIVEVEGKPMEKSRCSVKCRAKLARILFNVTSTIVKAPLNFSFFCCF